MKKKLNIIVVAVLFLAGLSVLLYPFVANQWNTYRQSRLMSSYEEGVAEKEAAGEIDYEAEWAAAKAYNDNLMPMILPDSFAVAEASSRDEAYMMCLNINDDEVMGIVEIPKIDVELPIYHTTDEDVLQIGAGHLEGSSLPVGGESTHAVISAHRGLPSATLFTDLDKLEEGDHFLLHILDDTLAYEVDRIDVVEPDETELLSVVEGEDLVTLLTCTPYGVNTQRLLVRGHRVPYVPEEVAEEASDSLFGNSLHTNYIFWVVVGLALTGAFIGVLVLRDRYLQKHPERMRKRRRRRHAAKETGRESDGGQGREP